MNNDESKIYYFKYPRSEFIVGILLILVEGSLLFLLKDKVLALMIVNIFWIFFFYHILVMIMTNKFNKNYIVFNKDGVIEVKPFRKRVFVWNEFKGYIILDKKNSVFIIIQMKEKQVKINFTLLPNTNAYEIVEIIEKNKVNVLANIENQR